MKALITDYSWYTAKVYLGIDDASTFLARCGGP